MRRCSCMEGNCVELGSYFWFLPEILTLLQKYWLYFSGKWLKNNLNIYHMNTFLHINHGFWTPCISILFCKANYCPLHRDICVRKMLWLAGSAKGWTIRSLFHNIPLDQKRLLNVYNYSSFINYKCKNNNFQKICGHGKATSSSNA